MEVKICLFLNTATRARQIYRMKQRQMQEQVIETQLESSLRPPRKLNGICSSILKVDKVEARERLAIGLH